MLVKWTIWGCIANRYAVLLAALLFVMVLASAALAAGQKNRKREELLNEVAVAERALAEDPDNRELLRQLAQLLYESGDFWRAIDVIRPVVEAAAPLPPATLLAAELEYLLGHYEQAEKLYRRLLARADVDRKSRAKARDGLGFVYYQTNRFDRMQELGFESGSEFAAAAKVIRSFDSPPYRVKWTLDERTSEAPLLVVDPLPVMTVQYNGRPVHVLFDTGADMCILDSDLADQWGIKSQSSDVGAFGGGKLGRMGYGKLDSVTVGSVVVEGVPIVIMPTQKFSSAFAAGKYPIGGIVGTSLIRQFLATLDYEHEKFVLRERSPRRRQTLRDELAGRILAEVPFVLTGTHYMMARGSLDGRDGLTFFVDSGLAADAALSAPTQTLRFAGIDVPNKRVDPRSVGGGGGAFASGQFPIQSLGLGSLRQQRLKGEYGAMVDSTYWQHGFIQDGLISHAFLRKYASWTIDFDAMKYIFAGESSR